MTGAWNHAGPGRFVLYALDLLVGKRGFLGHNLPLVLALPGAWPLLRRRAAEWPEVLLALAWGGGVWLAYAVTSTNYSGLCCSVRWFVPLLAPGYFLLAVLLRDYPKYRSDFTLLSGWGAVMGGLMVWHGPWMQHLVPGFWFLLAGALLSWGGWALARRSGRWRSAPTAAAS
jgi:hypothetical protein